MTRGTHEKIESNLRTSLPLSSVPSLPAMTVYLLNDAHHFTLFFIGAHWRTDVKIKRAEARTREDDANMADAKGPPDIGT